MQPYRILLLAILILVIFKVFGQPDIILRLNRNLFPGKKIIKVKRDFYDPYLWVLAANNQVYRVNTTNQAVDDYTVYLRNGRDCDIYFC